MQAAPAQPLLALDAVVVDTETTGLDPAKARIVQIGAMVVRNGRLVPEERFERLVDPGCPIPPAAIAIHGIDDAAVRGAAAFAEAFTAFETFRAGRVVIGHNLGFDLALFRRECRLAGLDVAPPPGLDTRLLGQICFPTLAGFTLEILADRLGLTLDAGRRHDAVGDAESAGRIFVALIPFLRDKGIRTLAEAHAAGRRLDDVMQGFARAGWEEPRPVPSAPPGALERLDAFPFRHRVGDLMGHPPAVVDPATPLAEVARRMIERRVSSLFVSADAEPHVAEAGIVTERDMLRAVVAGGEGVRICPWADWPHGHWRMSPRTTSSIAPSAAWTGSGSATSPSPAPVAGSSVHCRRAISSRCGRATRWSSATPSRRPRMRPPWPMPSPGCPSWPAGCWTRVWPLRRSRR